nr:MAG TPA: hypothetical protein [Caudoviricetes sp.]
MKCLVKITNGIHPIRKIHLLVLIYRVIETVSLSWLGFSVVS